MRITANQVTLARIFLLPVPAYMLIYGETVQWWIAFGLFLILGATDFVDGWMARREGPTRLGSLIDPMADKIFIAAIMLSMVATGVFGPWAISALLLRELLMTALRSSVAFRREPIKTSTLAKLKTIIQMGGLGTIFLSITLPSDVLIIVSLILALPFLAVVIYYLFVRKKMPFWAVPVFACFILLALLAAFVK
ncbi:MAG TPA: CDP-alcohol phosphatidyltransferase family protein, partial [Myxococcota bacterium]|nr:CDP-alcohol phosphatidyltransferase family protein [Myxococcota bacterium]